MGPQHINTSRQVIQNISPAPLTNYRMDCVVLRGMRWRYIVLVNLLGRVYSVVAGQSQYHAQPHFASHNPSS